MRTWYVVRCSDNHVWSHTHRKWAFCIDGLYEVEDFGYASSGGAANRLRALRDRDRNLLGRERSGEMELLTRKKLFERLGLSDPTPDPEPEPKDKVQRTRVGPTKAQQRKHALAQAAALNVANRAYEAVVF